MLQLQEEITSELNRLKQEIDCMAPDLIKSAINALKVPSLANSKKQDIIKALTGSKTFSEPHFVDKLSEALLRHLLRIRKNHLQSIPGLNPNKPTYLGQLITTTFFFYED